MPDSREQGAMDEDDRKRVYISLLRGVAKTCQDRLCKADEQHAWGPVIATDHWPDFTPAPMSATTVCDVKIMRSFRRECDNCGKVERW